MTEFFDTVSEPIRYEGPDSDTLWRSAGTTQIESCWARRWPTT